jgi:pimeloyl-ACP methyl ester carboxylesterase
MSERFPTAASQAPKARLVEISQGRRIAVRQAGTGVPLVLLHGFPLDHSMWDGQWALVAPGALLDGVARLIVPDLAGFGGSDGPTSPSIAAMADEVVAILDALGCEEPVVACGLSMGGYVAQHLAARHPSRLRGLVLVDTKLEADTPQARAGRVDLSERVGRLGARIAAEAMVPRLLARDPGIDRRGIEARLRGTIERTNVATIRTALGALGDRPDMTAAAARFALPTLLVVGAEDLITPPECLERAAAVIDGADLVTVPGCGHMTPMEDPAAFNARLGTFLRERFVTATPERPQGAP